MPNIEFHMLKISALQSLTADATLLEFDVPDALKTTFHFTAGQYITLKARILGKNIRRSYSLCSSEQSNKIQVAIKHQQNGGFSHFARSLKVGDSLQVMPPQGRFVANALSDKHALYMIAGSGITPALSMVTSLLEGDSDCHITMLYGNKSTEDIMFLNEVEHLKNRFMTRFSLFHFLSQEQSDIDLFNGRITPKKLEHLDRAGILKISTYDRFYLCGPVHMTEEITTWLQDKKILSDHIKKEIFAPKNRQENSAPKQKNKHRSPSKGAQVKVILDGRTRTFNQNPNEMLLDAAKRGQIELPHSCTTGMCATCRARLTSGKAKMLENYSLEKWEIERGFILACQTQPLTPNITLDFDDQ